MREIHRFIARNVRGHCAENDDNLLNMCMSIDHTHPHSQKKKHRINSAQGRSFRFVKFYWIYGFVYDETRKSKMIYKSI